MQELGCVDWNPSVGIGDNRYEVHMLFMCVVFLYVRVMQQNDMQEWTISIVALHKVLKFLVLPCTCKHVLMEQYFEDPGLLFQKEVCAGYCSYCKKDNNTTGGRVQKEILTNLLTRLFMGHAPTSKGLVKVIKLHKEKIYQSNDVPNRLMGPIHALCLQLIANGMILLLVHNDKQAMIGKTDLRTSHVVLKLQFENDTAAVLIDRYWDGFNLSYTLE